MAAHVGLGYMKIGQQANTLSGGEAQRVKLSKELSRRSTGRTLYILDEPTTGLHFHDVAKLLDLLQELVDAGNTVVVIEHNLEVIKTADHVVDIGPEGGDGGGQIVVAGTPEQVARSKASHTGRFCARCCGCGRGQWRPSSVCARHGTPTTGIDHARRHRKKNLSCDLHICLWRDEPVVLHKSLNFGSRPMLPVQGCISPEMTSQSPRAAYIALHKSGDGRVGPPLI